MKKTKGENNKKILPQELMGNLPVIEITGNSQVLIEGSKGILQYENELIKINTNTMVIAFTGRGLNLKSISKTTVIVQGYITSVEFIR